MMNENPLKKLTQWLSTVSGKSLNNNAEKEMARKKLSKTADADKNYFQLARTWADDYYTLVIASRNRYRAAFLSAMGLCLLLSLSVMSLSHTHEYIPLMVHHYGSGAVSIEQAENAYMPESQAEVESELVRYIVNRESYDPASFSQQYKLVTLMSDNKVSQTYHHSQSSDDQSSFIATFGSRVVRSVKIQDVNFLDNADLNNEKQHETNHKNLAEVNFVVTDKDVKSGTEKQIPYVAILTWTHAGIPNDPEARWMNWNGFTITHYQRNQRTL
jgi:type IV secretion system protein VirB8